MSQASDKGPVERSYKLTHPAGADITSPPGEDPNGGPLGARRSPAPGVIVITHDGHGRETSITVRDKDGTLDERASTQEWVGRLVGELLSNRNGATRIFIERGKAS